MKKETILRIIQNNRPHLAAHQIWAATDLEVVQIKTALRELLSAVTSRGFSDTREPITWRGSQKQNRDMYDAIDKARVALAPRP